MKIKVIIHNTILSLLIFGGSISALADHTEEIKKLKDEEELLKAREARDTAEANAINASTALSTAKANAINNSDTIETATITSETAKIKAKVEKDYAKVSGMKAALGDVPDIGNSGTVAFVDGKNIPVFMPVQQGSLKLTWDYANKICEDVNAKNSPAYIINSDLETKFFVAKDKLNRQKHAIQDAKAIEEATGLKNQVEAHIAPAIVGAALSAQYIAGAIQAIANLIKVDTSVKLGDNKDRSQTLKYFISGICPGKISNVEIGDIARYKEDTDVFLGEISYLDRLLASVGDLKLNLNVAIPSDEKKLAALGENNPKRKDLKSSIESSKKLLKYITDREPTVARIKTLLDEIRATPGDWIAAIALDKLSEKVSNGSRISLEYSTQDAQVSKTNWLLGTRVYGTSYGELTYRITNKDGNVVYVGYLIGDNSTGKLDLTSKKSESKFLGQSKSAQ